MDNLAICLPMQDDVSSAFCLSLVGVVAATRSVRLVMVTSAGGSIVTKARDYCIEMVETSEASPQVGHIEWLMWFDDDMQFPPDTVERLLKREKDIVGCAYPRRKPPHDTLGKTIGGAPLIVNSGLVEMEGLGFGCILMKRNIFEKFRKPYFRLTFDEERGVTHGEDFYFCARARELGYKIWCDIDLSKEIGHVGEQVLYNQEDRVEPMKLPDAMGVWPHKTRPFGDRLMNGAASVGR